MYTEGSFSVPTSLSTIAEAAFLTASMSSLMLWVVSMMKPRALLDLLEIPNILEEREQANKMDRERQRNVNCGTDVLQEGSVTSRHSNVLQQLASGSYRQACSVSVEESVVGFQSVFIDAAPRFDQARLIHRPSVTAFTFLKKHFKNNLLLLLCYYLLNV